MADGREFAERGWRAAQSFGRLAMIRSMQAIHDPWFRRMAQTYRLPGGYRRVYLHHVRKTGGTSLAQSFMALGGEDPSVVYDRIASTPSRMARSASYGFVAFDRKLLRRGNWFFAMSHRPAWDVELPPETFTVAVLRDPLRRIQSHYRMLVERDTAPFPPPQHELAWAEGSFAEFLEAIPREHLLRQLYMFSPNYDLDEAADAIRRCNFVFGVEHYQSGLQELAEKLDLPLHARHDRSTRLRLQWDDADLARLRELLEPEYRLLDRVVLPTGTDAG